MKDMKITNLLAGAVLCGLITMLGCAEPEAVTKAPRTESTPIGSAETASSGEFTVTKPESFTGEFNPNGLEVGPEVGMLAPEIEGPDLDGVQFKLSDYRGKVVMLDFYGDW
jgi:hypothetical protein